MLARPEADLRLDVAAAFEALPPHYRDVVLMRDVKEMTVDEIADALGASRQTVKARLHRARVERALLDACVSLIPDGPG